jgi:hypothetical protein
VHRRLRSLVIGSLVAAAVLMLMTGTGLFDKADRVGKLAQVYGAYVWANLILLVCLLALLGWKGRGAAGLSDDSAAA